MTLQYEIAGGQLVMDKAAFAKEVLIMDSPIKKLIYPKINSNEGKSKVIKDSNTVTIDFNHTSGVVVDEGFYDMFKKLKIKYGGRLKGKIVVRISAITSYYVTLNLESDDEHIIYE